GVGHEGQEDRSPADEALVGGLAAGESLQQGQLRRGNRQRNGLGFTHGLTRTAGARAIPPRLTLRSPGAVGRDFCRRVLVGRPSSIDGLYCSESQTIPPKSEIVTRQSKIDGPLEVPTPYFVAFPCGGDVAAYARAYTGFLRAVSEPVVRAALYQPNG